MPIKSLVDHNRGMGIPFDGAPTFQEDALLTTFKSGAFTADFDIIAGPFPDECSLREDKDKCEAAKTVFTDTKQRAIDWASTNEQNALKKIMYTAPPHPPHPPPPSPPSPPPGQLVFNGVQAGFEPEVEDAVNKFGEDIEGAEGAR